MSLLLAIAIIVFADIALIGLLTFVMSRAKLLTPHASSTAKAAPRQIAIRHSHQRRHAAHVNVHAVGVEG
jgi:hypothetical protein